MASVVGAWTVRSQRRLGPSQSSRGCSSVACSSALAHDSPAAASGHGIFGLSNFEWPSLVATISFMTGGIVTRNCCIASSSSDWASAHDNSLRRPRNAVRIRPEPFRCRRLRFRSRNVLFRTSGYAGIIGTAVVLTAPGLWLIQRRARRYGASAAWLRKKPIHRGTAIGGLLFGVRWSMAGMRSILVNIGRQLCNCGARRR